MSNAATVTIPYSDFEAVTRARNEAILKVAELEAKLKERAIVSSDQVLLAVAHAGIEIARYAIASLPAESNKHWPATALRTIAANLSKMPGASADEESLALTFGYFADEVDLYEHRRKSLQKNTDTVVPAIDRDSL